MSATVHHHEASYRFPQSSGSGIAVGMCNCRARVWRPISEGATPAGCRNPWTLRDSEPMVTIDEINALHAQALTES